MTIYILGAIAVTALLIRAIVSGTQAVIDACRSLARFFSPPDPVRLTVVDEDTVPMERADETAAAAQ